MLGGELIGRIAAQTCRQPGLSVVYMDLLDFGGDEIYFATVPELAGQAFGDALHAFRESTPDRHRAGRRRDAAQPADGPWSSAPTTS